MHYAKNTWNSVSLISVAIADVGSKHSHGRGKENMGDTKNKAKEGDGLVCPPRRHPASSREAEMEVAAVGLPGASEAAEFELRRDGIDPERLSISTLGRPAALLRYPYPPWLRRMAIAAVLWAIIHGVDLSGVQFGSWLKATMALVIGVLVIQAACDAFITATVRLAARLRWDHYVAGTVAEILSTLPELVVIAFVIPISPQTAFIIAVITIYNNTLVFSLYSFFLPKDQQGKFLMPTPITEAGTRVLIAGSALGLILGLVMMAFSTGQHPKTSFQPHDLFILSIIFLMIFGVYLYKLVRYYASEEEAVREVLDLSDEAIEHRKSLVYKNVTRSSLPVISGLFFAGLAGAAIGGEQVAEFAETAIKDLGLNSILTALVLAGFAGMSEYVILWQSHRKREYGIALANAFGGITQVMFLVLPFTLLSIGIYQSFINPGHPGLPIQFTLSNIFLISFLYPTFFVLAELLEEDHTFGLLDTTIMTSIVLLLILLLVTYGAQEASLTLPPR